MTKLEPYEGADKGAQKSWPQTTALLVAIVIAAFGMAPVGLVALFKDVTPFHDLDGVGPLIGMFWIVLLLAAGYALYTKNKKHAAIILFMIGVIAVLNLGGCAIEFARVSKALG